MDKDDKKKMGDEKFNLYRKIRKTLQQKNKDSKKTAEVIENVLEGKHKSGSDSRSGSKDRGGSRSRSRSKSSGKTKADTKDKVKSAVNSIKGRLDEKNKARKEDQKKKLE